MPTTTTSFLPLIAAGDASAVALCIDEFGGMVYSLADRYLRASGGDVDDAVQEIFIEVWRCAGRFDPKVGSEASFIATIAHRRLVDRCRRMGAGPKMVSTQHTAEASTGAGGSHLPHDLQAAVDAFEELEHDDREVIRLAIQNGLSHSGIAAAIGIPLGTVKTRLRRGLMRIRELLHVGASPAGASRGGHS